MDGRIDPASIPDLYRKHGLLANPSWYYKGSLTQAPACCLLGILAREAEVPVFWEDILGALPGKLGLSLAYLNGLESGFLQAEAAIDNPEAIAGYRDGQAALDAVRAAGLLDEPEVCS